MREGTKSREESGSKKPERKEEKLGNCIITCITVTHVVGDGWGVSGEMQQERKKKMEE